VPADQQQKIDKLVAQLTPDEVALQGILKFFQDGIAGVTTDLVNRYGSLTGKYPGLQAHHLNQNAAFKSVISRNDGISVVLYGNICDQKDSPHSRFHQATEAFWNHYREGGDRFEEPIKVSDYLDAVQAALRDCGFSLAEARGLRKLAAAQLGTLTLVPRLPGTITCLNANEEEG